MPHPASWEARIDDLIQSWRDAEAASVNSDPTWRYIAAWLAANKPPPLPLRLTHGDPQAPNVMVDHDGNYLVVDWEFAAIGDPREDLGWYNIYSTAAGPNLYEADPEAFLAAYREVTGFGEAEVNQLTVGYFTDPVVDEDPRPDQRAARQVRARRELRRDDRPADGVDLLRPRQLHQRHQRDAGRHRCDGRKRREPRHDRPSDHTAAAP